jgi:hypothetical protein
VLSLDCLPPLNCSINCDLLVVLADASNPTLTLAGVGVGETAELTQLDRKLLLAAFTAFRVRLGSLKSELQYQRLYI